MFNCYVSSPEGSPKKKQGPFSPSKIPRSQTRLQLQVLSGPAPATQLVPQLLVAPERYEAPGRQGLQRFRLQPLGTWETGKNEGIKWPKKIHQT